MTPVPKKIRRVMRRLSSRQVAASSMSVWPCHRVLVTYRIGTEVTSRVPSHKFFSDENLSESVQNILITIGNTSTSHWPGLSHEAPRDLSPPMRIEKIDLRQKLGQATHAQLKPPCFAVYVGRDGGPVAYHSNLKPSGSK